MNGKLTIFTLLLTATPALAAPPVVWHQVPHQLTDDLRTGALTEARRDVDSAREAVSDRKDVLANDRRRRADARDELRAARADVLAQRVEVWAARRHRDPVRVSVAYDGLRADLADVVHAREHLVWHRDLVRTDRAKIREAEARVSLAVAQRERAEAHATPEQDIYFFGKRDVAYQRQVEQHARFVQVRDDRADDAQARAAVSHASYAASR